MKTTFVQLADGTWELFSRGVPIADIQEFDKQRIKHCVIVMHEPKLYHHGRAYLAHLLPEVEPTTLKTKERKFIHEGRS